ncbi:hypothetical protein BU17DRAFT_73199 [Hysterangium stoloniferum]|nr:hypothetical protein BU17DRAFT_73199 [Hysterangium stoloniferum]
MPSTRLIELETLLRQRDAQNEQLTIEVTSLRRFLTIQTSPSTSEQVTLPPPLLSLLLPFLAEPSPSDYAPSGANSVTVALTQRAKLLQEENDELFDLLKHSETGRLKEEVSGLRRAIRKMESALRESHIIINSLSTDLDKCYEALSRTSDVHLSSARSQAYSENSGNARGHGNSSYVTVSSAANSSNAKPIPTGPRAQKRPRLSQASPSPQQASRPLPSPHSNSESPRRHHTPLPSNPRQSAPSSKMDLDGGSRSRKRTSPGERQRDRGRDREWGRERDGPPHQVRRRSNERDQHEWERERERVRDKERDRERERGGRRNGNGRDRDRDRRGPRGNPVTNPNGSSNRGLAERMGL